MATHNNNVGSISAVNVSVKGTGGEVDVTTDTGSLFGLRYVKDNQLGTGNITTAVPADVGTVDLKDWFAEYVGVLGNFTKEAADNNNIKFGDYRNSTILGFKVRVVNETTSRYKNSNNAGIRVSPLNGALGSYSVQAGTQSGTVAAGGEKQIGRANPYFNSGQSVAVIITDLTTGVNIRMNWQTGYGPTGGSFITGTESTGIVGERFNFTWSGAGDSDHAGYYSDYLYFFLGKQDTRPYGGSYV